MNNRNNSINNNSNNRYINTNEYNDKNVHINTCKNVQILEN